MMTLPKVLRAVVSLASCLTWQGGRGREQEAGGSCQIGQVFMYTGTIGGGADPVCRSIPGGASVVPAPVFYPCLRGNIPQCSLDGGQLEVGPAHSQAGGCQFLLAAVCRAPNFVLGREYVNGGGHWRSLEVTGGHWRSLEVIGGDGRSLLYCCSHP